MVKYVNNDGKPCLGVQDKKMQQKAECLVCMRGNTNICDDELWQGTSKATEGHLS